MSYIIINLLICTAYILFAGSLRSKYCADIRHRGIELSSDILVGCVCALSVGYVLFAQDGPSELQMIIYLSMYIIELIALVYGFWAIRPLSFEYPRQRRSVRGALFAAFVLAAIQLANFYYHYL